MSDDELDLTFYMSATDTHPHPLRVAWAEFADLLAECSEQPWQADDASKKGRSAFTLARLAGTRRNAHVVSLSGICADVDVAPTDPAYLPFGSMVEKLRGMGVGAILYTTTKSTAAAHRYRIVMRFPESVAPARYRQSWHAVNAKLGGIMDRGTHDPSRLMFTPARWQGKADPFHAFKVVDGGPVLTVAELAALPSASTTTTSTTTTKATTTKATTTNTPGALDVTELAELAHGKADDWRGWSILADLSRSPLVCDWARHTLPGDPTREGSRNYRFCKTVVWLAQAKNYPINLATVTALLEQWFAAYRKSETLDRDNIESTARHALAWCYRNPPAA